MPIRTKTYALALALSLPILGACEDTSPSTSASPPSSPLLSEPDPSKPQLDPHLLSGGFVVNPSFTGPLLASSNTVPPQTTVTLTISTNMDVGPTPYYIEIFEMGSPPDAGAGTRIAICGSGTTCSSPPITPSNNFWPADSFAAYVGGFANSAPPPSTVASSPKTFVAESTSGWTLSLPSTGCVASSTGQITATANVDVGPTPYYIEIFDQSGKRLAFCGGGTTCTATYQCGSIGLMGFISDFSTSYPPSGVHAASNTVIPTVLVQ